VTDPAKLPRRVSTEELRAELDRVLSEHFGAQRRVASLDRRPSPFQTSFTIEHLQPVLEDGASLDLVFKDLSRDALNDGAQKAKPLFLYDPLREIETYRSILASAELSTATCFGAAVDSERRRHWLFLEDVAGVALWQIGELETWEEVARWLAEMHLRLADEVQQSGSTEHLLRYDADFYRLWIGRARDFARQAGAGRDASRGLEWLESRYDSVVERLVSLPLTVIHGDFYASNILVTQEDQRPRVCPIDWEMAAIGPGLMDLAALTTGKWSDSQRASIASAYRAALGPPSDPSHGNDDFSTALDHCRLHLAVQWVGWATDWRPPRKQRQDWLGEALRLAVKLGL
jgi:hypothetical protein